MNYVAVFKQKGVVTSLFFTGRDEKDVVYKNSTLIRNEDDVINAMLTYIEPDNREMVIQETLLDSTSFMEETTRFLELQRYL